MNKTFEYSVGCGLFGIYAGVLKPNGEEWKDKTDVTSQALAAVAQYMADNGKGFMFTYNGKRMKLIVTEEGA